jgi:succinate-acetate transporter protein
MSEPRKFANPSPLGLCAFALTTFLLSAANADFYKGSGIVLGTAAFYGGFCQLLAGMWDFVQNNTFGATVLSSYGGFWMAYAFTVLNASVTITSPEAVGFFMLSWTIFTFLMVICALVTNVAMVVLLSTVFVTFALLTVQQFHLDYPDVTKAAGYFGVLAAAMAWYMAVAYLFEAVNHPIQLPLWPIRKPPPPPARGRSVPCRTCSSFSEPHGCSEEIDGVVRTPLASEIGPFPQVQR